MATMIVILMENKGKVCAKINPMILLRNEVLFVRVIVIAMQNKEKVYNVLLKWRI